MKNVTTPFSSAVADVKTHRTSAGKRAIALLSAAALSLAACSANDSADDDGTETIAVTTAFYPLAFLVEEVGGDNVTVTDLTPPGSDAHGVELSPKEVNDMGKADAVFYVATLSPAIDDAISASHIDAVDIGEYVNLLPIAELGADAHSHSHDADAHEHDAEAHEHDAEAHDAEHADTHDHDAEHTDAHDHDADDHAHHHGTHDPHFWTDPGRMVLAAEVVTTTLMEIDPDNAETYRANGDDLISRLEDLDNAYAQTFVDGQCETTTFVVTHQAFGYLAHEYGLNQVGIAGIDPELEPSPARIAEIREVVAEYGLTTIFTTNEGEQKVAETVADETGATAGLLDSAATQINPDLDYIEIMEANLEALAASMNCTK
ncbi:MAG: zinc ABC transporter substrate-binding protein [Actinomycetaceae bacterium]|nr:zinc ABC transporter substrate-binding protein [Actinomycetaceae bacterium]